MTFSDIMFVLFSGKMFVFQGGVKRGHVKIGYEEEVVSVKCTCNTESSGAANAKQK